MRSLPALLALLASLLLHLAAAGQTATGPDALYQAFGEKPGLTRLVDDFVRRLYLDPRIGRMFKDTKPAILKEQLTDQFCQLTGGPCKYEGNPMRAAHKDLGIRQADFHALVEVLQDSMDAQRIPFTIQNRLLALLAPMHREIITR